MNGVAAYSWPDTLTYKSEGVWYNTALAFEIEDLDLCLGHAADGGYHHHSYSPCLMAQLNDTGNAHSPIHGFAYDGFPMYGPYHANNTVAVSCWQPRDYSASSLTGCGSDGKRTCLLIDQFDYTKGVTTTSKPGPNVTTVIYSQSSNPVKTASGIYFQDYFYNSTCTKLGEEYLDQYNGHDHDGYGYHYHLTADEDLNPTFPYMAGPKFYGCIQGTNNVCRLKISEILSPNPTGTSSCGTSKAVELAKQQCLSYEYVASVAESATDDDNFSDDDSHKRKKPPTGMIITVVVVVIGGLLVIAAVVFVASRYYSTSATPVIVDGTDPKGKTTVAPAGKSNGGNVQMVECVAVETANV